jgi:hypothetical protein
MGYLENPIRLWLPKPLGVLASILPAGRSKWFARCLTAISALDRYPRMTIRIRITGQVLVRASPIGFIGHNPDLGKGLKIGAPTCLDQGRLCVYVLHQTGRWGLLRLLRSRGTHERRARHGASSSRRQSWRWPLLQVLDSRLHPPYGGLQCYDAGFGHLDVGLGLWWGVRPHAPQNFMPSGFLKPQLGQRMHALSCASMQATKRRASRSPDAPLRREGWMGCQYFRPGLMSSEMHQVTPALRWRGEVVLPRCSGLPRWNGQLLDSA